MNETKPKTVRGKCARCGKRVALTKTGRLRMHTDKAVSAYNARTCGGSRSVPVEGSVR